MATHPQNVNELLKHFDAEIAAKLKGMLASGEITAKHIEQMIKLTAAVPDYRNNEDLDSLLEDACEMDADGFSSWVGKIIEEEKDK
ncbi:MAG: hypothetical protein HY291_01305 [Planctomycetes bacterium]|nr:hypothetical protein [Planctomycetota bacterium]